MKVKNIVEQNIFYDILILLVFWVIAIILINPIGEFPLNDDWSFSLAVKTFLTTGEYSPSGWTAMTLFSQVLWGALFCEVFEYSFSVLRFSTLTLSFIGLSLIFLITRMLTPAKWVAYFVTFLIAFNPIYFSLSFTFMTDIPFAVFTIISLYFYLKSLQTTSINYSFFIIGTVFSIIAILDRQIGLFIPLAFAVSNVVRYGNAKSTLIQSFLAVVLSLAALAVFNFWLKISGNTPALYGSQIHGLIGVLKSPITMLKNVIFNGFIITMYIGLFLAPLLLMWFQSNKKKNPSLVKFSLLAFIPVSVATISVYIFLGKVMPYYGNIFTPLGIGPLTLHDTFMLGHSMGPSADVLIKTIKIVTTIFSVVGASLLISFLLSKLFLWKSDITLLRVELDQSTSFFLLIATFIYLGPLLLNGGFDRYLIIPVIFIGLSLTLEIKERNYRRIGHNNVSKIMLVIFITFSVISTHDYLTWNRTRWIAINELMVTNISPSEIDGGFEFNGLFLYKSSYERVRTKSWWWVDDDKYIISFSKIKGYSIIQQYEFSRWTPFLNNVIYVLNRNEN